MPDRIRSLVSVSGFALCERARCGPHVPASGEFGLWNIDRVPWHALHGRGEPCWPEITVLTRHTGATIHMMRGETVMEDSLGELRKHLPIWRHGHGRVLVSGLGLGCVVRGLLSSDAVQGIDVIEYDRGVIDHIWPEFSVDPRARVHCADASKWPIPPDSTWDFAWHDIWCEGNKGLPKLHAALVHRFWHHARVQGFWGAGARFMRDRLPRGRMLAA